MSGVKGRSGRRRYSEANLRRETIQKAWEVTHAQLENVHVNKDQLVTAKDIVLKTIPTEVKQELNAHMTVSKEEETILNKYIERNRIQQS